MGHLTSPYPTEGKFCNVNLMIMLALHPGGISLFFFLKDFIVFLFLPKAPWYIVVYSSLWVLLVVACGMPPQRGFMSSAVSTPRIQTNETLGRLQQSSQI